MRNEFPNDCYQKKKIQKYKKIKGRGDKKGRKKEERFHRLRANYSAIQRVISWTCCRDNVF